MIFSGLYLAYAVEFGKALQTWDYATPGRCYHTQFTAATIASHPTVDKVYLGITCFYMFGALLSSIPPAFLPLNPMAILESRDQITTTAARGVEVGWPIGARKELYRFSVLFAAILQYPLHLYSAVALRLSNEEFLEGASEQEWGFGQVIALMIVADTLIKCGSAVYGTPFPPLSAPPLPRRLMIPLKLT